MGVNPHFSSEAATYVHNGKRHLLQKTQCLNHDQGISPAGGVGPRLQQKVRCTREFLQTIFNFPISFALIFQLQGLGKTFRFALSTQRLRCCTERIQNTDLIIGKWKKWVISVEVESREASHKCFAKSMRISTFGKLIHRCC